VARVSGYRKACTGRVSCANARGEWVETCAVQFNSHLFLSPIGARSVQFSSILTRSVQFNSHLFLSPIGARTLKMPVPYPPRCRFFFWSFLFLTDFTLICFFPKGSPPKVSAKRHDDIMHASIVAHCHTCECARLLWISVHMYVCVCMYMYM